MKRFLAGLLFCLLCIVGLIAAHAESLETSLPPLCGGPFAQKVKTGEIVHVGMSAEEAETITGEPVEESMFRQIVYDGVTLAYRDGLVVYIQIDDEQWAANGLVMPGMPTEQALKALGMSFGEGRDPFTLLYSEDGNQRQQVPGDKDYLWALTLFGKDTVGMITMGDRQYLLTFQ